MTSRICPSVASRSTFNSEGLIVAAISYFITRMWSTVPRPAADPGFKYRRPTLSTAYRLAVRTPRRTISMLLPTTPFCRIVRDAGSSPMLTVLILAVITCTESGSAPSSTVNIIIRACTRKAGQLFLATAANERGTNTTAQGEICKVRQDVA
ncbi:hypothetical protein DOTSEDRAFT_72964 [Dothistroma septosporum NZE10]|uniref:Uncharacterized protein n=1 Tax=Dothistroma septosporum (strain NZE10 / CBS 128990) TaxID=675120 RepID=N1PIT3_DOTSN|nr:hypothetical protein DOTSEDRAFT_72964 [Dothistroma septosporum NZE10]